MERGSHSENVRAGRRASHTGPGEGGSFPELVEATVLLPQPTICHSAGPLFLSLEVAGRVCSRCQSSEEAGREEAAWRHWLQLFLLSLSCWAHSPEPLPPSVPLAAGNQCLDSRGCRLQGLQEERT